jgi:hypothetical protein
LRPAGTIAWRPALDEIVLLDRVTGRSWLLDPAGAAIWAALVDAGSVPAALDRLPGADPDEVAGFADRLVAEGALEAAGG